MFYKCDKCDAFTDNDNKYCHNCGVYHENKCQKCGRNTTNALVCEPCIKEELGKIARDSFKEGQ